MNLAPNLANIVGGSVTRETDEKYAGGFWDAAAELLDGDIEHRQEAIYNMLWACYEAGLEIVDETPQPGIEWADDAEYEAQVTNIREKLESVHRRGRIEGLKEAERLAEDAAEASRLLRQIGEVSSLAARIDCGERADAIDARLEAYRARIQELERAANGLAEEAKEWEG